MSAAITVAGVNDATFEGNESLVIDIASATNANENGVQQQTITITDDDSAPLVNLAVSPSSFFENDGTTTVTATLTNPSTQAVTINLAFSGTATSGVDYSASGTKHHDPAGSTAGSITLTGLNDATFEGNESLVVDIASVTNGSENGLQQVTATIIDDDNSPPVNTLPGTQSVNEDIASFISGLSILDVDAGALNVSVILSVVNGSLNVLSNASGGVTRGNISGNGSSTVTIIAPQSTINATLANASGLSYLGLPNFNGTDALTVTANDLGNGGATIARTDTDTIAITIAQINDAPSFTPGSNVTVAEDAAIQTIPNWATAISVGPNESGVQSPTFVLASNNPSLFSSQPTIGSTGTLSFRPASNANGTATVTVQLRDNGGTANGGVDVSTTYNFTITVTADNDIPTNAVSSYAVLKSEPNPIQLLIDDGDAEVNQALTVALTAPPTHGTISGLNVATGSFIYTPVDGYTGADSLTVTITDDATAGGVARTATATIILSVGSVYSLPITTPRDIVWDPTRNQVYVSNFSGSIHRYDPINRAALAPLSVGGSLAGFDITPDGNALYIADSQVVGNQGYVRKLDLATSGVTSLPYTRVSLETGAYDVGIAANGIGFVSTNFAGSGSNPLRQIDLATDSLTARRSVQQSTQIYRSYDHSQLGLFEQNISSGPFSVFSSSTNTFPVQRNLNEFYTRFAFSRDNSKIAWQSWNGTLTILNASTLASLNLVPGVAHGGGGGVAFDPVRDILYAADANTDQVIAYRTSDWQEVTRISMGPISAPATQRFAR